MSKCGHPDPPAVVVGVLTVVGRDALREALQQLAHLAASTIEVGFSPLDQLDPVAVGVAHEAQPVAAVADRVRRPLGLDSLAASRSSAPSRSWVEISDVPVAGADLVGLVTTEVVGQLEPRLGAVIGEAHEHVDRFVADRRPPISSKPSAL